MRDNPYDLDADELNPRPRLRCDCCGLPILACEVATEATYREIDEIARSLGRILCTDCVEDAEQCTGCGTYQAPHESLKDDDGQPYCDDCFVGLAEVVAEIEAEALADQYRDGIV